MTNKLASSTSPYLQQHKENPVDWFPWGKEALDRARKENRPILLSVGYSSCHWCHVMAHESFEDAETADFMNDHFVNIKVDREERPDIDHLYMTTVQAMTGQGGWPMTVFLTPEGVPFFGGTYWPKEQRQGMPAFREVLEAVSDAYENRREDVEENAGRIKQFLEKVESDSLRSTALNGASLDASIDTLMPTFDRTYGGFGTAPKFPQPLVLQWLQRAHHRTSSPHTALMVRITLERMQAGGLFDQVGGGFHRYSVDDVWLVPHFEKMLYDNALLAQVYLDAWRQLGIDSFRETAERTLDWALRELTGPHGSFYSALDADTEGEEGKFYVWTPAELVDVLGAADAALLGSMFDVTERGNFEGASILHLVSDPASAALSVGQSTADAADRVAAALPKLLAARATRTQPGIDNKAITGWNALLTSVLAQASVALERPDMLAAAVANGKFLLKQMRPRKKLVHSWNGAPSDTPAFLDDYALLVSACIDLYQATFDRAWMEAATDLTGEMIDQFAPAVTGLFSDSGKRHEQLIANARSIHDGAVPSGNSAAAEALLRMAAMTGNEDYERLANGILERAGTLALESPVGGGLYLSAAERLIGTPREIALAGTPESIAGFQKVVSERFEPFAAIGLATGVGSEDPLLPFLSFRSQRDDRPTAYLCEHFTCMAPVTSVQEFRQLLESGTGILWREF